MSKKTIYIAGLGLIGGSLALGIKRYHPDYEILGYNRSDYSRNIALERGIVDRATGDFKEFAPLADVIILAVPIKQTMAYLKELADLDLKDNVIITDAGSTKREIVEAAERYLTGKNVQFVGSHPMAGSHKSGAIAADVTLFENAYYIFTPTSLTKETTIPELKDILSGLKSRYVEIDAAEHDRVTSQISHFPHLLASGLMEQAADYAQAHEMTNHFAAGGFRDMTRIAESEPGMWASILMTNGPAVLDRIEDFKKRLDHVADLIKAEDESAIWEFFDNGRKSVKRWKFIKRVAWKVPSIFLWMCLTVRTLSLALWNCCEERLWLTFVSMKKIVRIFMVSFKLLLKMKKIVNMLRLLLKPIQTIMW